VSEKAASTLLSAFWATYTVSRLITAIVAYFAELPAQGERMLILAFALASVVVLSGIVWGRGRGVAIAMVIGAGVAFGPIFPTIMGVLQGPLPDSIRGRAVGLLFAIGNIGTATIPAAMGAYAKRTSVQRGFLVAVGSAVGLSIAALALTLLG
jgi:fucose permease